MGDTSSTKDQRWLEPTSCTDFKTCYSCGALSGCKWFSNECLPRAEEDAPAAWYVPLMGCPDTENICDSNMPTTNLVEELEYYFRINTRSSGESSVPQYYFCKWDIPLDKSLSYDLTIDRFNPHLVESLEFLTLRFTGGTNNQVVEEINNKDLQDPSGLKRLSVKETVLF